MKVDLEDVGAFRNALQAWIEAHLSELGTRPVQTIEASVERDRQTMTALYVAGWSRYGWPRVVGGLGGNEIHRAAMYDTLAESGVELPEAFVILETLGPVLTRYAPDIARRHLGDYLRGVDMWAQGFSEPGAGSDLGALRTSATLNGEAEYILSGHKVWSTLGQFARYALVLARTGAKDDRPRHAMTMLWVDLESVGVTVRPIRSANGRDEFAEMYFDDVVVPAAQVIGDSGEGWNVAMYLLQYERGMYAWLRQSLLYARLDNLAAMSERGQSDRAEQAVGEAFLATTSLRNRVRCTVVDLAAGTVLGPEVSVDKVLLSQAEHATYDCAQTLLGSDFVFASGSHAELIRWQQEWFYSRATSIFGGAVEIQKDTVAKHVMKLEAARR